MSQGTIYVDCPCCGARLEARREDGKVVQHWSKSKMLDKGPGVDPIKAAMERERAEKEKNKNLLADATGIIERQKRDALDKFNREKERIEREGDDSPPPSPFGFD